MIAFMVIINFMLKTRYNLGSDISLILCLIQSFKYLCSVAAVFTAYMSTGADRMIV